MAMQPEIRYINAYVSGSVAYQPEKRPQKKQGVYLPKVKRQQKLVIPVDVVALGGILVAFVFSILMIVGLVQLNQTKEEAKMLNQYVATLQADNKQLHDTYTSSYDLDELHDIASAMGMVPVQEVPRLQMQVVTPQIEEELTTWESFWAFMAGLFA